MAVAKLDAYRDFLRRYAKKHPNDRRWLSRSWLWFIGGLIRYGYQPWRIALPIILALLYGGVIFSSAHHAGYMAPTKERVYLADCYRKDCGDWIKPERSWTNSNDEVLRLPPDYPEFNSLVYAIDTFFPIVDLHQEAYWSPRSEGFGGGGLQRLPLALHHFRLGVDDDRGRRFRRHH
ncbi:MAG: hypothetical protein VW338_12830 [Rhodospirillaceae bacterium]